MSQETGLGRGFSFTLVAWILVPVVVLGGVLFALLGGGGKGVDENKHKDREEENYLSQVRSTLGRQADLTTCRMVVQQLNAHLQQAPDHQAPALASAEKLQSQLGLQPDDLAEVVSSTYTQLDAHHLEACFLLRDAARSLEVPPMTSADKTVKQAPLDRAVAGFAWTVRQVAPLPPQKQALFDRPAPPAAVLRRGTGSSTERALVFLALLEQFGLEEDDSVGLQGCLVFAPDEKGQKRLWACGVAVGTTPSAVYLFDPRLGLPVPGPGGKGVATLAQAQAEPAVLGQLKIDKLVYDVSPEQAKAATLGVVCPLSSSAPRMQVLQDRLLRDRAWKDQALPAQVRVRLAEDPSRAVASLRKAVGKADEVSLWQPGSTVLRGFLPKEEGGNDTGVKVEVRRLRGFTSDDDPRVANLPRERLFQLSAVPWEEFPAVFRDPEQFRFDIGLGQRLRGMYAAPFLQPLTDPKSARDLLLRGRFAPVVPELVRDREQAIIVRRRLQEAKDLLPGLRQWVQQAIAAEADLLRARGTADEANAQTALERLWKWRGDEAIAMLMSGAIAGPRGADVMYQLALCRHEQAVRYQGRLDLGSQAGVLLASDSANARKTWIDAEGYWKEYLDANVGRFGMASARRLHGQTQAVLGQRDAARESLRDVSAPMTDLEKLASLWLAKQLGPAAKGG